MIADIQINSKTFGSKELYKNLHIKINKSEKVALIGRNGTGKSTLINIISGEDQDYDGSVEFKKGLIVVASRQEHTDHEDRAVIDYIAADMPEYTKLKSIIDGHPEIMDGKNHLITEYSDALDRFTQLGYFDIEEKATSALSKYQLDGSKASGRLGDLSGGQKRLVELVKVQLASCDLALIDEPTNHMDYVAKAEFIDWMNETKDAVVVISHDRDVLRAVDRVIEIRDGAAHEFRGNYDAYLRINTGQISNQLNQYQVDQNRIRKLEEDVVRFRRLKEKARNPGTIARFKRLENTSSDELKELQSRAKPSFWIDKDSAEGLSTKISEAYDKHKTQNINISTREKETKSSIKLVDVYGLSLGYTQPLFTEIGFELRERDRIEIRGRNGVGKSTLVKAIRATSDGQQLDSKIFAGHIDTDPSLRIGVYSQEMPAGVLDMTLYEAVEDVYRTLGLEISDKRIRADLSNYLFDPVVDGNLPMRALSGGQKARYQLIAMLAGDPNLLILDEPTNHLDLPSIEELEQALERYHGAVIYISHDSYFTDKMSGSIVEIASQ
ncbi:MAG: ABC-F family ATP-binding cassette domain-containing protein [Patescibacteria group bacterium]